MQLRRNFCTKVQKVLRRNTDPLRLCRAGNTRKNVLLFFIFPTFLICTKSDGLDPVNKVTSGLALKGYDAVAYFSEGQAVAGRDDFQHIWNGAKWNFTNASNRDLFARGPEKFAPKYGGYCAYAVSRGYTADGDPDVWRIVNGKLYLNYNVEARRLWEKDLAGNIVKGDENWPKFLRHKPEHKG